MHRLAIITRANYDQIVSEKYFYFAKAVLALLFIWKILSRDFSNIALWPLSVLGGYPYDIYPPDYLVLGIPGVFDLATFHWIHFFLPWPSANQFVLIETILIITLILFAFASVRLTRVFATISYVLIMWLWGFVFRLGQEIDAVFLLQGTLLVFVVFRPGAPENFGQYFKNVYYTIKVIFVIYYFFSGLNKLVDLSYIQWSEFDLVSLNQQFYNKYVDHGYLYVPRLLDFGKLGTLLENLGALLTYIVHIIAPLLLFYGSKWKVLSFWLFYSVFHLMTAFVGILFTMNFFAFLLILPVDSLLKKR